MVRELDFRITSGKITLFLCCLVLLSVRNDNINNTFTSLKNFMDTNIIPIKLT
jgi:hypothetical protein